MLKKQKQSLCVCVCVLESSKENAFKLEAFANPCWRRQWQPTPVLLPGESQGQGSLVGCHLWGRTELDTTEAT